MTLGTAELTGGGTAGQEGRRRRAGVDVKKMDKEGFEKTGRKSDRGGKGRRQDKRVRERMKSKENQENLSSKGQRK